MLLVRTNQSFMSKILTNMSGTISWHGSNNLFLKKPIINYIYSGLNYNWFQNIVMHPMQLYWTCDLTFFLANKMIVPKTQSHAQHSHLDP